MQTTDLQQTNNAVIAPVLVYAPLVPIDTTAVFCLPHCGAHCASCTTNGAGKCDEGRCRTGYVYHSSNQVCVECKVLMSNCAECHQEDKCDTCEKDYHTIGDKSRCIKYECKMCGRRSSFSSTLAKVGLVVVGHDDNTNCSKDGDTDTTVYCSDHCWVFRQEKDSQVVFMRGCFKSTVCDKYTYQNCYARKTGDTTAMTCFKCCSGNCATYVPGIKVPRGSDAATLSSGVAWTSFLVVAVV
ncbi:hypothetical protein LSAT2_023354, partial [Lamellibrachia satsuma]